MGEMRVDRNYCEGADRTPDAVALTTEVSRRVFQGQHNAPSLASCPHVQIRRRGHREGNELDDIAPPPKLQCSGIFTRARARAAASALRPSVVRLVLGG